MAIHAKLVKSRDLLLPRAIQRFVQSGYRECMELSFHQTYRLTCSNRLTNQREADGEGLKNEFELHLGT